MIYVPLLGFMISGYRVYASQQAALNCKGGGEACRILRDATWPLFDDVNTASIVTTLFLAGVIIALRVYGAYAMGAQERR